MNNDLNKNITNKKHRTFIISFLVCLLSFALGCLFYDRFIKKDKPEDLNNSTEITINDNEKTYSNEITTLKRVIINDNDQVVNVNGKEYKIKKEISVDGTFLIINDSIIELSDGGTVYADIAYVTNKYILFTLIAQDGEEAIYAIDKEGNAITCNSNRYQIHDLKINDGNIEASGHIFCGLDGDCPDKDLTIKYENNMIIVIPKVL